MISNIFDFEKSKLSFINAFRALKLNKLLNQSNPLNDLLYVVFDDVKGEKRKRPFTSSGTTYIICIGDYFVL